MKERFRGLIILLLVIALAGGYMYFRASKPRQVALTGLLGGEKSACLKVMNFKTTFKNNTGSSWIIERPAPSTWYRAPSTGKTTSFPPASWRASSL